MSDLRPLASMRKASSLSSATESEANPSESESNSARKIRARPRLNADDTVTSDVAETPRGSPLDSIGNLKRRRPPGSVATKACAACRQSRQKCDGVEPNSCSKCRHKRIECRWEPHVKESKDNLVRRIQSLQTINSGLCKDKKQDENLRLESEWQKVILQTIGRNGHDAEICRRLRRGEPYEKISDWLIAENAAYEDIGLDKAGRHFQKIVHFFEDEVRNSKETGRDKPNFGNGLLWTKVSKDDEFISHLFELYFTWVHPVHTLFSEIDFKDGFRNSVRDDESESCAPGLVNAICAMGCHLLDFESALLPQDESVDLARLSNAASLRNGFLSEAKERLALRSYRSMTSIQALAVIYIVELGIGNSSKAMNYLRSAVESLCLPDRPSLSEADEITFWGIRTLALSCAGILYHRLSLPVVVSRQPFEHVNVTRDQNLVRFYRSALAQSIELPIKPSHTLLTAKYSAILFSKYESVLELYNGLCGLITGVKIAKCYASLLSWQETLPPELQIQESTQLMLPHIAYMHIQYHFLVVQLLNPIMCARRLEAVREEKLRSRIVQHAQIGLERLGDSMEAYKAVICPIPVILFCCVHLTDALLVYADKTTACRALENCLDTLYQSRSAFRLCNPLRHLLCRRAEECGLQVPVKTHDQFEEHHKCDIDDILKACTRLVYTQPMDQIIANLDPHVSNDWHVVSQIDRDLDISKTTGSSQDHRMQIDSVLNS